MDIIKLRKATSACLASALLCLLWAVLFCMMSSVVYSGEVPEFNDENCIRAIIGEASGEKNKNGMLAIACAIRNRGTLKGVYGFRAKHVNREPKSTWTLARRAWERSSRLDIVKGADHWENVQTFGKPDWTKGMAETVTIGNHTFYKSK